MTPHTADSAVPGTPATDPRDRRRLAASALLAFALVLALGAAVLAVVRSMGIDEQRTAARHAAAARAHAIQLHVSTTLSAVYTLSALVRESQGLAPNFERVASEMLPYYDSVAALQLAPGGVIRRIVPLAGHEAALGHDLLRDPQRDKEAFRAIETRTLTLAGPFSLKQGGMGLVGRLPVFLSGGGGAKDSFWGFATVVIRLDDLLLASGVFGLDSIGLDYRLTRVHPDSGQLQVISRSTARDLADAELQEIVVPNGRWTLAVERQGGWTEPPGLGLARVLLVLLAALVGYVTWSVQAQPLRLRREVHVRTAALTYQATHDVLTGLANRALLQDRITLALAAAQQQGGQVAVLLLDLDRFKTVNDSLGHNSGDRLLSSVAGRLQGVLRQTDTLARLGGDEFVIVLPGLSSRDAVVRVCDKVLHAVAQPITIDQRQVWTGASVGIALHPQDGAGPEELLRNADAAMYLAKAAGGSGYRFYQPEMNASALQRLEVEAGLRLALERAELTVHYQPQVCTRSGRVVGAEALVRWNHPERGLVSPNEFIPVAEETGLIVPLGVWVLEQACGQLAAWRRQGHGELTMAVNLSPTQFRQPGLAAEVEAIITRTGVPAAALELELTERMVMEDPEAAARTLEHLRRIGIRTSLDDFGTGHSNLSSLRRFQIDALKIDRSFIDLAPENADDDAIARAIVALARSLGLRVVAEGVETQAQWDYVRAIGCDQGQGYLFAQALPAEVFAQRLLGAPALPLEQLLPVA